MSDPHLRVRIVVPPKMIPSKEAFLSVGFNFEEIPNSSYSIAVLPEGWRIQRIKLPIYENDFLAKILDSKGRLRAVASRSPDSHTSESLNLFIRYSIGCENSEDAMPLSHIFIRECGGTIIHDFGYCDSSKYEETCTNALNFLLSLYPNWEDPTKYWDD